MDVKVGDKVLLQSGFGYNFREKIVEVIKVTPTGRIKVSGSASQFDKNGFAMGNTDRFRGTACIKILKEEDIKRVNDKNTKLKCLSLIKDLTLDTITVEQSEGIIKILEV